MFHGILGYEFKKTPYNARIFATEMAAHACLPNIVGHVQETQLENAE